MNYIVTEGYPESYLLGRLLEGRVQSLQIMPAGGASALVSLVRTLLRQEGSRVVVVTDADSLNPEPRRSFVEKMLGEIAPLERDPDRWRVYVFTPELESLLFEFPECLAPIVGRQLTELEAVRGRYEPRGTLRQLLPNGVSSDYWRQIDPEPLRKAEIIQDMAHFLEIENSRHSLAAIS